MPKKSEVSTADLKRFIKRKYGNEFGNDAIRACVTKFDITQPTVFKRLSDFKVGRGKWNLTVADLEKTFSAPSAKVEANLVPAKDSTFVPFGAYNDIKKIISSKSYYPVFITGLSGNGKTVSVEQACANAKRDLIRVNITIETDEDDLIGGFRLVNGDTVWHNGPVVEALEKGAVLLLDEIDLASNKILCLQSVLEGKGLFLKKIGK